MIGLISAPSARAFFADIHRSYAPNMFPWSDMPMAGMPSRTASLTSGFIFAAPSSLEYSV